MRLPPARTAGLLLALYGLGLLAALGGSVKSWTARATIGPVRRPYLNGWQCFAPDLLGQISAVVAAASIVLGLSALCRLLWCLRSSAPAEPWSSSETE